jgi:hypothetical protein
VVPCSWQTGGPITLASDTNAARIQSPRPAFVLVNGFSEKLRRVHRRVLGEGPTRPSRSEPSHDHPVSTGAEI